MTCVALSSTAFCVTWPEHCSGMGSPLLMYAALVKYRVRLLSALKHITVSLLEDIVALSVVLWVSSLKCFLGCVKVEALSKSLLSCHGLSGYLQQQQQQHFTCSLFPGQEKTY